MSNQDKFLITVNLNKISREDLKEITGVSDVFNTFFDKDHKQDIGTTIVFTGNPKVEKKIEAYLKKKMPNHMKNHGYKVVKDSTSKKKTRS